METVWLFDTLALSVARIDFLDPAVASTPNARERGVRVEIRPLTSTFDGSIYVSSQVTMQPAVCRIDLLESSPGAADRMHWHPTMDAGEPGDRVFDPAISADPIGWLSSQLDEVLELLARAGVQHPAEHAGAAAAIAASKGEVLAATEAGLAWARSPWPDVEHDERGMDVYR